MLLCSLVRLTEFGKSLTRIFLTFWAPLRKYIAWRQFCLGAPWRCLLSVVPFVPRQEFSYRLNPRSCFFWLLVSFLCQNYFWSASVPFEPNPLQSNAVRPVSGRVKLAKENAQISAKPEERNCLFQFNLDPTLHRILCLCCAYNNTCMFARIVIADFDRTLTSFATNGGIVYPYLVNYMFVVNGWFDAYMCAINLAHSGIRH